MTTNQQEIIDAAFEVAVFSKTHEWPQFASTEFFEFSQKLDRLHTVLSCEFPAMNRNIAKAILSP